MRSLALALLLCTCSVPVFAGAKKVHFPYTTTILGDDVEVRAGPGRKYYPTARLRRGQQVIVHRHDPGGWHMIAPPAGSFSWVPASQIQKESSVTGVVTAQYIDVRVGGRESAQRDIFQTRLNAGDEVQILGEQRLPSDDGAARELWYRIAPPRGEWRWVPAQQLAPPPVPGRGRSIIPAGGFGDEDAGATNLGDVHSPDSAGFSERKESVPAAEGSSTVGRFADDPDVVTDEPGATTEEPVVERPYLDRETDALRTATARPQPQSRVTKRPASGPTRDHLLKRQLEELELLDGRLQAILNDDPQRWDFAQIDHDYRALREEVVSDPLLETIDTRLSKIDGFRRTQARRLEMRQILLDTERRDAQLVAALQAGIPPDSIITPAESLVAPPVPGPVTQRTAEAAPQFDGAGIVERNTQTRGGPRYVLLAPGGRLLAYLVPMPGVQLDGWLRQEAGILGRRVYDQRLRADVITVGSLTPVRLTR